MIEKNKLVKKRLKGNAVNFYKFYREMDSWSFLSLSFLWIFPNIDFEKGFSLMEIRVANQQHLWKRLGTRKIKGDEKFLVYVKFLIKESTFIQTFNYKLSLRKEFYPLNRDFRGSCKQKRFICGIWFGKKQFVS